MEKKKLKKRSMSVPMMSVLVVCLGVLAFSIWQLSGIFLEYKKGTDEYEELLQYVNAEVPEKGETDSVETGNELDSETVEEEELPQEEERLQRISFDELKALNSEIVGWIEIPGTQISYPIMHTGDNEFYLNHTFSGKVNSAGSIFVETLNSPEFTDLHTIVYGHNMKNGSMFAGLKNYTSPSFLVAHPTIYIDLEDGTHGYQIFSCYEAAADIDSYTIGFVQDEQYETFLQTLKSRSAYDTGVEVSVTDSVISLSTCTRNGENRYLVHAKKIY